MFNIYALIAQYAAGVSIVALIWYILLACGMWQMFAKAGEAGWKALIPIYNFYIMFKIAWKGNMFWIWVLCTFLGGFFAGMATNSIMYALANAFNLVSYIILIVLWYNVSIAYGHGLGYFLGLWFLQPIFLMIIGFGSSRFVGNRYAF